MATLLEDDAVRRAPREGVAYALQVDPTRHGRRCLLYLDFVEVIVVRQKSHDLGRNSVRRQALGFETHTVHIDQPVRSVSSCLGPLDELHDDIPPHSGLVYEAGHALGVVLLARLQKDGDKVGQLLARPREVRRGAVALVGALALQLREKLLPRQRERSRVSAGAHTMPRHVYFTIERVLFAVFGLERKANHGGEANARADELQDRNVHRIQLTRRVKDHHVVRQGRRRHLWRGLRLQRGLAFPAERQATAIATRLTRHTCRIRALTVLGAAKDLESLARELNAKPPILEKVCVLSQVGRVL